MTPQSCPHQYCPGDHCVEKEDLRACRHMACPANRCLRAPLETFERRLDELGLSSRAISALERGGIRGLADLLGTNPRELILIKNLGIGSLLSIVRALKEHGLRLQPCFRSDFKYSGLRSREIDILVRATAPTQEGEGVRDQERLDRAIEALLRRFKDSGIGQSDEFKELSQSFLEFQDPGDVASS